VDRRLRARDRDQDSADLIEQLNRATKSRDAWLGSQQNKQWLKAAGIAVGAASAVLAVVTAPVTPVALAAAGLTLASGTAIPGRMASGLARRQEGRSGEWAALFAESIDENQNHKSEGERP